MARAERIERLVDAAAELRLAVRGAPAETERRVRRAERLLRREIGPSVPKQRVAALLGISRTALERWLAAGALPVVRRPHGREEVETAALLDLLEEVRALREAGASRAVVAAAVRTLGERGLPRLKLRPNTPSHELRSAYLGSSPEERLRETAELSRAATTLAGSRR